MTMLCWGIWYSYFCIHLFVLSQTISWTENLETFLVFLSMTDLTQLCVLTFQKFFKNLFPKVILSLDIFPRLSPYLPFSPISDVLPQGEVACSFVFQCLWRMPYFSNFSTLKEFKMGQTKNWMNPIGNFQTCPSRKTIWEEPSVLWALLEYSNHMGYCLLRTQS